MMKIFATEQLNILGVFFALAFIVGIGFFFDINALKSQVGSAGALAPLLFIALKTATVVFVPLSGAPLYPLVGAIFGFWPGVLYMVVGDAIGYTIAFTLARTLGAPIINKWIQSDEKGIFARIIAHMSTTKGFIHTCIAFCAVPELIAYGAGLSKISYPVVIGIMILLSTLASSVLVFIGASLGENVSSFGTLLIPVFVLIVFSIGAFFFSRSVYTHSATK